MSYQIPSTGYGKGMPPSGVMPSIAAYSNSIPTSGMLGKGMPRSGMMPSMPIKGYTKGEPTSRTALQSGKKMGKHDWEIEQEEGSFGFLDDEEEVAAYPGIKHQQDLQEPMVPIPWQRPKAQKVEEVEEKKDVSFDYLTRMSTEQLQEMAEMRQKQIMHLKKDVDDLTDGDQKHEDRLAALEKKFGQLCHGSDLQFKAPLLAKISKMVRDSHLLDHDAELERMKDQTAAEEWADLDPWSYIHSDNLVMGRGFMRLDQDYIEKVKWQEKLKQEEHPVVSRLHYGGHVAKPAEDVEAIFVKEAGVVKKSPLHPAPYRNNFWLSLDGPTRDDAEAAREAEKAVLEDPVARRVQRQNVAGTGEDAQPVDWLGKIKHGEIIDDKPPKDAGFVMPSWMY